jgi:L-asparaginase II
MGNPVLVEITRGRLVESRHAGAVALVHASGEVVAKVGDIAAPIFPRSAIKPLQAIPFVESGAVDALGLGPPEIALACGSHTGTRAHAAIARAMLERASLAPAALACGVHEPMDEATARELVCSGTALSPLHHNCSGKHAAMLATAVHMHEPVEGYWRPNHGVQRRIAQALGDMTGLTLSPEVCGIDGCSVPNWAIPLAGLARAFARLATGANLPPERAHVCRRIAEACWAHPDLVAGPGWLVTQALQRLSGKALLKSGAEGVYCGAFAERGLGFALKIDDGARRAAEPVAGAILARAYPAAKDLRPPHAITNWRGIEVGRLQAAPALQALLDKLG